MDEKFWENGLQWWQNEQILWFNGEWWVNSAPAFLSGLIFANYEKQIVAFFKKNYMLKFHVLLAITALLYGLSSFGQSKFGYWTEWNGNGPEIGDKIITYFMQIPLLIVVPFTIFMLMMKYHVKNPVWAFFGKYSLHTYLMNLAAITLMRFVEVPAFFDFGKGNYLIYGLAVIAISTFAGVKEQQLTEFVQRLLFREKKKVAVAYNTRFGLLDNEEGQTEKATEKKSAAPEKAAEKAEPEKTEPKKAIPEKSVSEKKTSEKEAPKKEPVKKSSATNKKNTNSNKKNRNSKSNKKKK